MSHSIICRTQTEVDGAVDESTSAPTKNMQTQASKMTNAGLFPQVYRQRRHILSESESINTD